MEVESDNKTDSHKNTVSSPVKVWAFRSCWKSVLSEKQIKEFNFGDREKSLIQQMGKVLKDFLE